MPYHGIDHAGGVYLQRLVTGLAKGGHEVRIFAPGTANNLAVAAAGPSVSVSIGAGPPTGLARRSTQFVLFGVGANAVRPRIFLDSLNSDARSWLSKADLMDLQWFESLVFAPLLRARYPAIPIVGTAHDVLSQSVLRARSSGPTRAFRMKNAIKLPLIRRWEGKALRALDRVVVFKESDVDDVRMLGVKNPVDVTIPVIETFEDIQPIQSAENSRTVVFVAAFVRPENDEAARWLVDEVIPQVRAAMPNVSFRFAGSNPPNWLKAAESPHIQLTGYLPDMSSAYAAADCIVVPLRRGAGLKFKTIQAMALGIPVVSTHIGAEGIVELSGFRPQVVTDDPRDFAAGICQALVATAAELDVLDQQARRIRKHLNFDAEVEARISSYERLLGSST